MGEYCVFEEEILYDEGMWLGALIALQVFKTILFSLWQSSPSEGQNEDGCRVIKGLPDEEETQNLLKKSKRPNHQFMRRN